MSIFMGFPFLSAAMRKNPPVQDPSLQTGIVSSTPLYTPDGAMPAEHVMAGDRIISRTHGTIRVEDIWVETYSGPMVRFAPDTLGRARPESFLQLPPDQRLVLRTATGADRDGIFAARDLVDGDNVKWYEPKKPVRLARLFFGSLQIVYAGGLELEISG